MAITRKAVKKASKPAPKVAKAAAHKPAVAKKALKASKAKKTAQKPEKKGKKSAKPVKDSKPKAQKTATKPQQTKKAPEAKKVEKKKPATSSYIGYTTGQYQKFLDLKKSLAEKTNNELKEMCRKNAQKVTGTKDELVERVADGKVLGSIPKCQSCGGGRPKWNAKSGTYRCPGYMEDSDFINCNKSFSILDITRSPWQD